MKSVKLTRPELRIREGQVEIPGSKSISNRALLISALSAGEVELLNISPSDDTKALLQALQCLGIEYEVDDRTVLKKGGKISPYCGALNISEAGTAYRFLIALAAHLAGCKVQFKVSKRLAERPIRDLLSALQQGGATIESHDPLCIVGAKQNGGHYLIKGDQSSQFLSALLLTAPMRMEGVSFEVSGDLVSESYINMTTECMKAFGVTIDRSGRTYSVASGQNYKATQYLIEPDLTGATYFWAIGALGANPIRVPGVDLNSAQGDARFPEILEGMGCKFRQKFNPDGWIEVGRGELLHGIDVDMSSTPDAVPTLAVVAAFARGKTRIFGVSALRHKESDRLAAIQSEFTKLGVSVQVEEDVLTITGGVPQPGRLKTYNDHRLAMAFAVFSIKVDGIEIEDPDVVNKSFPGFWEKLQELGIGVTVL